MRDFKAVSTHSLWCDSCSVYPEAARSLTGLRNSHKEKDTELTHSLSLLFFHGFLKQRGENDWPIQICTMPILWNPRMPTLGLGMMQCMNGIRRQQRFRAAFLSNVDSTGLETLGFSHHQSTEGLSNFLLRRYVSDVNAAFKWLNIVM